MTRRSPLLLPLVILALTLVPYVRPAAAQDDFFSPAQNQALDRIERYLNSIDTVRARFLQSAQNGGFGQGTFYLDRPGRLRIEYDPPVPYLYVADHGILTFVDHEFEQRSDVPLRATMAGFLARDEISLRGDLAAIGVGTTADGLLRVDIVDADDPQDGRLILLFRDRADGLELAQWVVVDSQGLTTEITLIDPVTGLQFEDSLFDAPTFFDRETDDD